MNLLFDFDFLLDKSCAQMVSMLICYHNCSDLLLMRKKCTSDREKQLKLKKTSLPGLADKCSFLY